ncbi:MAG: SDR family oxidoreductase [Burkholderiales bacterium]|nr:MAG: SDR family oxidoreductase [Burkholderiales bacterium]
MSGPRGRLRARSGSPAGTALITGASSGIGEALARCFAAGGHDLVLVARSADTLKALAASLAEAHGVKAWAVRADLSEPDAAPRLAAAMKRAKRPIDVLVNNAGVLEYGPFAGMTPETHRRMIDLNVGALTQMLAHFVPPMLERGHGRVLNVASIAAFQPIPSLATYAATKAFVLSMTESLAEELRGTGVTATALCPGVTATNMLSGAARSHEGLGRLPSAFVGTAESVAAEGYEACLRGETIRVPGRLNLAAALASRATPKWLVRRLGGAMSRSIA